MSYQGDIVSSQILYFKFTTRKASTGAPFTLGGSPSLAVYKDDGTTESTAGITLTADFDSKTGLNSVKIDTSADAFYAAGHDFDVVIAAGTVDGVSVVNEVVGSFSISNRSALRPTTAGRTLAVDAAGLVPLSTTERDAVADALLDRSNAVETGMTVRQQLRLASAALFGKLSGSPTTTLQFRNGVADSKVRITATVDANGNRTAITPDAT